MENGITGQAFIYGCSAIGAGLALIAGIGPGVGQGMQQVMVHQQLVEIQELSQISHLLCF